MGLWKIWVGGMGLWGERELINIISLIVHAKTSLSAVWACRVCQVLFKHESSDGL